MNIEFETTTRGMHISRFVHYVHLSSITNISDEKNETTFHYYLSENDVNSRRSQIKIRKSFFTNTSNLCIVVSNENWLMNTNRYRSKYKD